MRLLILLCFLLSGCCFGPSVRVDLPPKVERPEIVGTWEGERWYLNRPATRVLGGYMRSIEAERDALRAHPAFGNDE